ncbi:MAG TPA: hypothetical protein PKG54_17585 [Phycisphaerae bacterium]|jgi:hypothetical protein|nr:hypothetical protein [Phycisphaerae bacterium]HOJ55491.1 hypothetical protein [Phycisphaerae bacterium]HOL26000.1 hypothetical protein [Phycisphaerae bacterium]HPP22726.1 hypothetical protein [Phycisphaerae bacterium]HPU34706.1 hypothetical protein [Phycisphaerae bacterium]
MNRKRWIYASVLGIALVAFIVDRLFLASPQAAEAKPASPDPGAARPAPSPTDRPQNAPFVNDASLAWLEKLAPAGAARDIFASPDWLESKQANAQATTAGEEEEDSQPGSAEAFEAAHRLQATTVMGRGGLAVVDGQCLSVGETLDGFRLVRVEAGQVEFRRGSQRVTLSLPMAPAADQKIPPVPSKKRPSPARP